METPKILIEKVNGEYSNCRIPGIVCTESGALLAYYECRREVSDWADIDIKIIKSVDHGETWSTVKVIPSGGNTLNNPVMIVNGKEIHFLYFKNYKNLFVCKSVDDGESFTEAKEISDVLERGGFFYNCAAVGPGHGIVHRDVMIVPIWFAKNKENEKAHQPSFIGTIYSKDSGTTWELGEILETEGVINPSECALGINKDGNVLISIRNDNPIKRRALAVSKTGYDNWSKLSFCDSLMDPICQGSLDSRNGKLFHVNCEHETERKNLCVKISQDDFQTYEKFFIDEEGGYADIAVTDDNIYIFYERDVINDGLYFKKIKNS